MKRGRYNDAMHHVRPLRCPTCKSDRVELAPGAHTRDVNSVPKVDVVCACGRAWATSNREMVIRGEKGAAA